MPFVIKLRYCRTATVVLCLLSGLLLTTGEVAAARGTAALGSTSIPHMAVDLGYEATRGRIQTYDDFAVLSPRAPAAPKLSSTLVQTIEGSLWSPPSPDSAGIVFLPDSHRFLISDSEVNETPLYRGANMFESAPGGQLLNIWNTLPYSGEPTGLAFNPATGHLFISDDSARAIFEVDPVDGQFGNGNDLVTSFDAPGPDQPDPEGLSYAPDRNELFIADGSNNAVYRLSPGANHVFDGLPPGGDDRVTSFDTTSLGLEDPEGIAYNPENGNLYLAGKTRDHGSSNFDTILEVTISGDLVRAIDVSQAQPRRLSGLSFAPGSLDSSSLHLYIVDRGVDNNTDPSENDGKIYEMSFPVNILSETYVPIIYVPEIRYLWQVHLPEVYKSE